MTDFERLVKQLGGNPVLKPGEIGISDVQTRNAQTAAVANKPAAVIKPAIKPASNVPTIHALGAGDYGASKRTRLDNTVNAGIKSTQASFANIRGQLLAPTGELTIGQNAQAAVHGISQQEAEAQKTASQRKYQAKAYALADSLAKQSAEDTAKAKSGLGKVGSTLVDVGVAGTQMLGDLATNAILPGSALAAMGIRSYGQSSQQARQTGANELQQVGYGAASAAVETLTEKMFDGVAGLYGGGVADDVVEKVIGKIAKSTKGMTALRALANFSGEGLEEIVSDAVNPIIRSIYDGKSVGENYSQEKLADWLHDGLVGGVLGVAGAGTQVITGANASKNAEIQKVKASTAIDNAYGTMQKTGLFSQQSTSANKTAKAATATIAAREAQAVIQSLAGTRSKSSQNAVSPQVQNVTPETQNAPTVERGAPSEAVQPNSALYTMSKQDFISNPPAGYVYKPSSTTVTQEADADTTNGVINLTDKFFDLSAGAREFVLAHESNHFKAEKITSNPQNVELMQAIWGLAKSDPNTKYFVEKNVDEVVTELLTDYQENPEWLKSKHPQFYAIAEKLSAGDLDVSQYGDIAKYIPKQREYPNTADGSALMMLDDVIRENPELAKSKGWDIKAEKLRERVFPQNVSQPPAPAVPENSVITPPQEQNAPTAKQDVPTEIAQPKAEANNNVLSDKELLAKANTYTDEYYMPLDDATTDEEFKTWKRIRDKMVAKYRSETPTVSENKPKYEVGQYVRTTDGKEGKVSTVTMFEGTPSYSITTEDGETYSAIKQFYLTDISKSKPVRDSFVETITNKAQKTKALDYLKSKGEQDRLDKLADMTESRSEKHDYTHATKDGKSFTTSKYRIYSGENNGKTFIEVPKVAFDYFNFKKTNIPLETSANTASVQNTQTDGLGAADKGFTGEPTPFDVWSDNTPANQMHPVGENPTRAIDLPKVNPQGQNTMATGRTVMEAAATPNSRIPEIQQYMVDGNLSYVPVENSTLAENASKDIEYSGWDAAHTKWVKAVSSGKTSPELVAMGATLLNNAGNTSTVSAGEYLDLMTDYAELLDRSGRALQAGKILKTLSPEGRIYGIQRSVQSMVEEMKNGTEVTIDADLIDEYRKAETDEARDKVISKIQQNVADQIPSTVLDKFTALRYVNMLGNFKTQARNIAGNAGMMLLTKAKNETAAAFEKFLPADQRTKSFGYSKGLYSAAWKDFLKVQSIAMGEGKFQEGFDGSQFAKEINDKRTIFKNNGEWGTKSDSSALAKTARKVTDTLWKAPEAYRRATNLAMEQGDVIFNRITYADTLAGYLRAKGYSAEQLTNGQIPDDVLDKARMFAIKEAQEATFRDTNALSGWVSKVGRRKDTPKAVKVAAEGTAPFRKTPANIAVRAEEYSPLGLVNTAVKAYQVKHNTHEVSGADVVNSLAKTVTGSGLAFIGFVLAKAGWLRGKSDDDKQEDFDKLTGQQDYSVQIPGGVSFTLDWLTPGSMPIFMGAQLYNAIAENGFQAGDIEKTLTSIADPMVEMSMLSGVNDALDNIKYAENNLGQFALSSAVNYLTQGLTNTMAGQIERTVEDTRKTTFINREQGFPWLQTALGKASAKTPGVDYNQINYIDAWGRKTNTGSTGAKSVNNFFNPAYVSKNNTTALDTELQRLYDAGQTNVLPQRAETSTKVNDEYLTGDEYEKYQTTKGQTSYNILRKAVSTFDYKNMTDEQKAKAVAGAYEYSTYKANRQIAAQRGETSKDSEWDKYADAEKNGIDFWTMWKIKHPEDKNGNGKADEKEQKAVINALAGLTPTQKTYIRKSIK